MNLYGMVGNNAVGKWDIHGMYPASAARVDASLSTKKANEIQASWITSANFNVTYCYRGEPILANTRPIPRLECECSKSNCTLKCVLSVGYVINLISDGDFSRVSPEEAYGHEQIHVAEFNKAFWWLMAVMGDEQFDQDETCPKRAADLEESYSRAAYRIRDGKPGKHSDELNGPQNPNGPAWGTGYPTQPGSPAIPPRPPIK